MSKRLQKIEIRNFKAFRSFELEPEGRHVLIYGGNGAGKSSLYWALYTFLQSAHKGEGNISKYFEAGSAENLLNYFEQQAPAPRAGGIALTFRDTATGVDTRYPISEVEHGTRNVPEIRVAGLASDFVTYRFFFRFSDIRNSERFDVWPLFAAEVLPFCASVGGSNPLELWQKIESGNANPANLRGVAARNDFERYERDCERFSDVLVEVVRSISDQTQAFYDTHFADDDASPLTLQLGVTRRASYNFKERLFTEPVVEFGVQINGTRIQRPQVYFNEAKLTQMALSIRFAASLVGVRDSPIKLLVLDDLLISLDMSNRMRVVDILLSDSFDDYQKIVLTHDFGFFKECRRRIGTEHTAWDFVRIDGSPEESIQPSVIKNEIQKAQDYLKGHHLEEAALNLRKAAEETVNRYLDTERELDPTKEFRGLADSLRAAKDRLSAERASQLYNHILSGTPAEHRDRLIPEDDRDIEDDETLSAEIRGRLKHKRIGLRRMVTDEYVEDLRRIAVIDDVLAALQRVLNPAMHAGDPPLYAAEIQKVVDLIQKLDEVLHPPPTNDAPAA